MAKTLRYNLQNFRFVIKQEFFLFYYDTNFMKHNINFFRYIDDIIVFNWDNFEDIFLSIYPKELVLKNTNSNNFSSFLDLKISFVNNNWLISVYDKRLDFNFKVNSLTNWSSCISRKVLKNILFSQLARIKRICNNSDSLTSANRNHLMIARNSDGAPRWFSYRY